MLTQAREVVQLYRSPGLSASAGAALLRKAQAKVSGDIVDVDSELARPRVTSRKNVDIELMAHFESAQPRICAWTALLYDPRDCPWHELFRRGVIE